MKIRSLSFVLAAFILVSNALAQGTADSKLSQSWTLGSKLALAGAVQVQGGDKALVDQQFAAATASATALGVKLPPLPARKGSKAEDSMAVLGYLLQQTGIPIGRMLTNSYGVEHTATFEVALKSNMLLILYGPGEPDTVATADAIRRRFPDAKYLPGMTAALLGLIDRKATYDAVKSELFSLHDIAPKFIAVTEYTRNGDAKYNAKDYSGSAVEFTKAMSIDPTGSEYYFGRGRAYMQLGKNQEAIADYTKVIQLEGNTANAAKNLSIAYHNRGLMYGMSGTYEPAIADLTQAIKLRPDYASAYKVRGLVYEKMGNAAKAKADIDAAEKIQPGITR